MYSDFMSWLMKTIVGINPTFEKPGFARVVIEPAFIGALDWAHGSEDTAAGMIETVWKRTVNGVELKVTLPVGITAEVRLPGGRVETLTSGGTFTFGENIKWRCRYEAEVFGNSWESWQHV